MAIIVNVQFGWFRDSRVCKHSKKGFVYLCDFFYFVL